MPLKFLLDENLRGVLWLAITRYNRTDPEFLDVIRIGDPPDLPLGSNDIQILKWAEREQRILISRDAASLPDCLARHLQTGLHNPGIFMLRRRCAISQVVAFLVEAAYRSNPAEWKDRIEYVP